MKEQAGKSSRRCLYVSTWNFRLEFAGWRFPRIYHLIPPIYWTPKQPKNHDKARGPCQIFEIENVGSTYWYVRMKRKSSSSSSRQASHIAYLCILIIIVIIIVIVVIIIIICMDESTAPPALIVRV